MDYKYWLKENKYSEDECSIEEYQETRIKELDKALKNVIRQFQENKYQESDEFEWNNDSYVITKIRFYTYETYKK